MSHLEKIKNYIDEKRDEIMKVYKEVIEQESYHSSPEDVTKVAQIFKKHFENAGFSCELTDVDCDASGPMLTGILGAERKGKPVIFGGHMDTVHKPHSFPGYPDLFQLKDGNLSGPGVLDMKGGIVIALYACKALEEIGFNKRPIKICFAPDEEKLHKGGKTADIFTEFCKGGECMFNMETGLLGGELCISRKGKNEVKVTVEGVSAHAGNDFKKGRNAIAELSAKILEIQKLTNTETGTTICTDMINGGLMPGAFPEHAEATIDVRATTVENMNHVLDSIKKICEKTHIQGTSTKFEIIMGIPPFECTEGVMQLYNKVHDILLRDGFGDFACKHIGGSSDAAYSVIAGVPALCSCGAQGEWNHTPREYVKVESIFTRSVQWAHVISQL